ncbi:MAG TPA: hypothetical protein VJM33_17640 [Microthrixaceae bacterium]|nr:hypothetical protein [Microthrixaceae bacterium]
MPVDVFVGDDVVAIHLTGLDALWSLTTRLILSTDDIVDATVVSRSDAESRIGWRIGGTHVPGRVTAGNFNLKGHKGERARWAVFADDEVLQIETRLERPRYVVLQHPDRHDLAWLISERLHRVH